MTVSAAVGALDPTVQAQAAPRVLVSAGEASGDAHTADVITALRRRGAHWDFGGMGGSQMAAAGVAVATRMESLSTIGFTSVIHKIPAHMRLLSSMRRDLNGGTIALALLTDYPGFHLRVAWHAARSGVPVLYYVAPQLWAWGERRVVQLRRTVTHLAAILPFEETFFRERGVATTFVGHPLLDRERPNRQRARSILGLNDSSPALGLFPGSRPAEVRHIWPGMREAADRVREAVPDIEILVAAMQGMDYPAQHRRERESFRVVRADSAAVMAASDAVLCKSGTATLEAALARTPLVICYRTDALSYAIAKRLVRSRHVGLVNLVAGREIAPEYIQRSATPAALARAIIPLLDRNSGAARRQIDSFGQVRESLGPKGAAGRVADLAMELLSC